MTRSRVFAGVVFTGMLTVAGSAVLAAPPSPDGGGSAAPSFSAPAYDPVAEYRAGVAFMQASKFKEAIRSFDRVLAVAPTDTNSLMLRGLAYASLNDLKSARRNYEAAVRSNRKLVVPHRELGLTYLKLGMKPDAQRERDALQAMADKCKETCPEAADLKAALTSIDAVLAGDAKPSAMLTPGPLFGPTQGDGAYLRAVSLINQHRYEDAIVSLEGALLVFGPHPDVLTYMGFSYRKLHRYDEAERYYRRALDVAPNHRGATEYYGELKVERGDLAGARKLLAQLEKSCAFGCPEAEELRRWIDGGTRL